MNGLGQWTYSDTDNLIKNYYCGNFINHSSNKNKDGYIYCNLENVHYFCENNGKTCVIKDNKFNIDYKPTIKPSKLLNIDDWAKIYYYQAGENDGDDWIMICQNKKGVYIYFRASCDYTGFDCQGGGEISYSSNEQIFWNHCLDNFGRTMVLKENGVNMKINMK